MFAVYLAFFLVTGRHRVPPGEPYLPPGRHVLEQPAPHRRQKPTRQLAKLEKTLSRHGIHLQFIKNGKTALQTIQDKVAKSAGKFASFGGAPADRNGSAGFDLVLVFVLSVYMLLYGQQIGALVRRLMPPGDGTAADDYPMLIQHAVSRYVGGQLLFSVIMGLTAGIALYHVRRSGDLSRRSASMRSCSGSSTA